VREIAPARKPLGFFREQVETAIRSCLIKAATLK